MQSKTLTVIKTNESVERLLQETGRDDFAQSSFALENIGSLEAGIFYYAADDKEPFCVMNTTAVVTKTYEDVDALIDDYLAEVV